MRKLHTAILGGVAMLAVAGAALAAHRDMHVMNVSLPGGAVARIEYEGDVAPKVIVTPAPDFVPVDFLGAADTAPFAAFDRIAASMSRDMSALIHEIGVSQPMLPSSYGRINLATLGKLPPGTFHYQFVSTNDGSTTCNRSVEVTSSGPDHKPKVVSNSSGNCMSTNGTPSPTRVDGPVGPAVPGLTRTGMTAKAQGDHTTNII